MRLTEPTPHAAVMVGEPAATSLTREQTALGVDLPQCENHPGELLGEGDGVGQVGLRRRDPRQPSVDRPGQRVAVTRLAERHGLGRAHG